MRNLVLISSVVLLFLLNTCIGEKNSQQGVERDLKEIKKRGKLIVVTNYNSIDYFVFRGQPMGFQFELLQRFAEYSGLQLEIVANNDFEDIKNKLIEGDYDLIASGIPVTLDKNSYLSFTEPLMQSRQVLVQRKPDNWKTLNLDQINNFLVNSPLALNGKTVVVQRGTSYATRLRNIEEEIGGNIDIVEVSEDEEHIMQFVAGGEIDYTICDEGTALVNKTYFPQLDVSTVVGFPQNISWAVRKNSKELLSELNKWIVYVRESSQLAVLYNKYYQNQWSSQIVNSDYYVLNTGRISPYDEEIKEFSHSLNWDWRLLASLIYKESNFNPSVTSYAGAYGLMQITPATAQRFGVDSVRSAMPNTNMAIGVMLLKWLDQKMIEYIKDPNERIKFVLASYNVGIGHVIDAMLLTKKYNKDMTRWDDVQVFLLNKSKPQYYKDPIVKFGYCGGVQTVTYVSDVLSLYKHYKNIAQGN